MTILSDTEIRQRITGNALVPGGDPNWAKECSYSFRPGRGFIAGDQGEPVDFLKAGAGASITVQPGKMVWIRTRDRVLMPKDIVGFWWQTNTLSRKGLMLVNMSMVEPGYEGDLACLLVNFGDRKVIVEASTVIAKMVFIKIAGEVANPFAGQEDTGEYDAKLRELAVNQPSSFLQIGDLAVNLSKQQAAAIAAISQASVEAKANVQREAVTASAKVSDAEAVAIAAVAQTKADAQTDATRAIKVAQDEAIDTFKTDAPKAAWKGLGFALLGFLTLTAAMAGAGWLKDNVFPDNKKIARSEAEDVLRQRVTVPVTSGPADEAKLANEIEKLNARIQTLENKVK